MKEVKNKGLLLINLGSPDSTSVSHVQTYLNEFLMDGMVIDYPVWFRFLLMRGLVIPLRAPKSAEAYRKIWTSNGSPLIIETERLTNAVRNQLQVPVAMSMRYRHPRTAEAFAQLLAEDQHLEEVMVLPLYPHYTMSSYGTAVEHVKDVHRKGKYPFKLKFLSPFFNNLDYISVLANTIKPFLDQEFDTLLFSFHGVPVRHMRKDKKFIHSGTEQAYTLPGIDYQQQCIEATRLVAEALELPPNKVQTSFQSRLTSAGADWLKPYTAVRLEELPAEGTKKLLVVCPSFINDCLETLEEIALAGRESFIQAGGESLTYIPCINSNADFVQLIEKWFTSGDNVN